MEKAFLYDSLCGIVYRCMFAGVDNFGHAHWVIITPGEEPQSLVDYLEDAVLENTHFCLLCMEGELAQSSQVAKVLGKLAECPIEGLGKDLSLALNQMKEMGVKWDKKPLDLTFKVFDNSVGCSRQGKYSFWAEDNNNGGCFIIDIDGFDSLEELFWTIRTYLLILEDNAGISILNKKLRINSQLKKEALKRDLGMFDHVEEL